MLRQLLLLAAGAVIAAHGGRLRAAAYSEDDAKLAAVLCGMSYIDRPGHDSQTHDVYVVFRSQHDVQRVTTDKFRMRMEQWTLAPGVDASVKVVGRVQAMFGSVKDEFDAALASSAKYAEEHGSRILFTGHSSGGSLAHLAAFYAHQAGLLRGAAARTHVISFGAARVGNTPFSRAYAAALPNTYRVVRRADPFVHRPHCKTAFLGRKCKESADHGYHVPTEVYYEGDMPSAVQNDAISTAPNSDLYRLCSGGEDPSCTASHFFKRDDELHMSAFGVDFLGFCEGWKRGAVAELGYDENMSRYLAAASMMAYAEKPSLCDALGPVRRGEWEILREFRQRFMSHEIYGFLVRDTRDKRILSVWRGTNKGSQLWDQVFNSGMIDCPYDRSVKLIKYYRDAFGTVEKDFLQQLQSTMNQHKGWNLFFTGHSLGGALATMAAYTAAKSGVVNARSPDVRIMTFGQPRVGDTAFSFDFSSYYPRAMRIVYGGDPVPHVPFCAMGWNWHYERSWHCREDRGAAFHFPTQVYYPDQMPGLFDEQGEILRAPDQGMYRTCLSEPLGEDVHCHKEASFPFGASVDDHVGMFNTPHITKICERSASGVKSVDEEAATARELGPNSALVRDSTEELRALEESGKKDEQDIEAEEKEVDEEMEKEMSQGEEDSAASENDQGSGLRQNNA